MNNILLKIIILNIFVKLSISYNNPKYTRNLARENYKLVPYFAKKYYSKHKLNFDQKQEWNISRTQTGLVRKPVFCVFSTVSSRHKASHPRSISLMVFSPR